jgi:phosphatidylinositol alpha-1,6-mannosyltransferase
LDDRRVAAETARHKVFCQLPRSLSDGDVEGFGIVFLEAAAQGIPVVAGASGGVLDAVDDGKNGFLVDPEDVEGITDKLQSLIENEALNEKMAKQSLNWASRFYWGKRDLAREAGFLVRAVEGGKEKLRK